MRAMICGGPVVVLGPATLRRALVSSRIFRFAHMTRMTIDLVEDSHGFGLVMDRAVTQFTCQGLDRRDVEDDERNERNEPANSHGTKDRGAPAISASAGDPPGDFVRPRPTVRSRT